MHERALWLAHGGYVLLLTLQAFTLVVLVALRWRELQRRPWMARTLAAAAQPPPGTSRWWCTALPLAMLVAVVAGALRWSVPASPQVLYDEFWYLSTARHMRLTADATPALFRDTSGTAPAGDEFRPPYPQGWAWLETVVAEGASWPRAVMLQRGVGVAASVALFATFAAESLVAATFAGLGLAILPAFVRLGQGASAEGASALFVIVAFWAARSQRWRPGPAGALLALGTLAWAMHFRPENGLYLAIFLPLAFWGTPRARTAGYDRLAGWGWQAVGWLLFVVCVAADLTIMADGAAGPHRAEHFVAQPRPGFATWQENMVANLQENVRFFFDGRVMPRWLTLTAGLGVLFLARGRWFSPLAMYLGWIALFTVALSPFPFGDFPAAHSLDTWRFSVQVSIPMLALGARGVEWGVRAIGASRSVVPLTALGAWMALSTAAYWPFMSAPHRYVATWDDLARVAALTNGPVAVSDESVAVALQEGWGVDVVALPAAAAGDAPTPAATPLGGSGALDVRWLLVVGDEMPQSWRARPLDLRWTTGPVEAGRDGLSLYWCAPLP